MNRKKIAKMVTKGHAAFIQNPIAILNMDAVHHDMLVLGLRDMIDKLQHDWTMPPLQRMELDLKAQRVAKVVKRLQTKIEGTVRP